LLAGNLKNKGVVWGPVKC